MTIEHVETVAFLTLFEFRVAPARFLLGQTVVLSARSNQLFQRIERTNRVTREIEESNRRERNRGSRSYVETRENVYTPRGLIASVADSPFEEERTNDNNARSNDSSKGTRQTS